LQLSTVAVFVVAILHIGFFILESVLWTSPKVRRLFENTEEAAQTTRVLALNQGFYNLGSAALLIWFHTTDNTTGVMGVLLFLAGMGLVGAITANWRILLVQSLPAITAFLLLYTP
jgi:putative membrane protein